MTQFPDYDPRDTASLKPGRVIQPRKPIPLWRRLVGWMSLLGAVVLLVGAVLLLVLPRYQQAAPVPQATATAPESEVVEVPTETLQPTESPANPVTASNNVPTLYPTISRDALAALVQTPVTFLSDQSYDELTGLRYDPFTIVGNRARGGMISYIAVEGDTIEGIAARFGLETESISWCNNRNVIFNLRPGDALNIPPVNGACHLTIGGATLEEIAQQYKVDDAYVLIDSIYNALSEATPQTIPASGTRLFIPGGDGGIIYVEEASYTEDTSSGTVAYGAGKAGSCGNVATGGGSFWGNPLQSASATWMRGFFPGHTGIDIAAPEGTPVLAANSGPVLFSGNGGPYGNLVVLGHGPYSTFYAHMSVRIAACGQSVNSGDIIGYVGTTGNSTGPHLHFEIRYRNVAQDPSSTPGIGW